MKRFKIFIGLAAALLLASCNFTEEINLNPDGSGSVSLSFDGSDLMNLSGEETATEEQAMDSVIYFSRILEEKKDSISTLPAAEQERLKQLEPYRMRMLSDPVARTLLFSLERDFTDISEVGDSFSAFQDASALDPDPKNAPISGGADEMYQTTRVDFRFSGNRFSRRTEITDPVRHQQRLDSLAEAEAFLSGSTYTLKIKFPRRVRSANAQTATLSMDGLTLIHQVDFLDYLRDPAVLDLDVELED